MNASQNRLTGQTKELRAAWEQTRHYWNDAKSAEFEKRFLDDLFGSVTQTVNHIDTLERILTRIHDDCDAAA